MNRIENLRRLANEEFDLCIIGGGASGAGCALDATLRGLKVALIEKTDFAAETSSRSTKLVHGGVRYLEQAFKNFDFAQLRQVRHGLEERRIVLQNAPHLAHPLGLITPVFSWWEGFYYTIGLKLYDWFAGRRSSTDGTWKDVLPPSRWLSKQEALQIMPGLTPRIHSAVLYFDGQLDDARYCLALVQSAAKAGAVVGNHLEIKGFQKNAQGKLAAVSVQNNMEPEFPITIKARQFLNCTGPFSDHIRHLANPDLPPRIRPSKGVHLALPFEILNSKMAMLIPKTRDGRMVFAIPFEGAMLLGTTDEPYVDVEKDPVLESREVQFLLETLQPFVSNTIDKEQVKAGFGGIRPLLQPAHHSMAKSTKSLLRDHEVELDPSSGLISLLGGKWTTYRLMASDAINQVFLGINTSGKGLSVSVIPQSTTENYGLFGSEGFEPDFWKKLRTEFNFDEEICQHLASKYGGEARRAAVIAAEHPELSQRILPKYPFINAEIVYAVREEMAIGIRDFLARRIRLEFLDWEAAKQAAPVVAKWMGAELGWSEMEQHGQTAAYMALLESFVQRSKQP